MGIETLALALALVLVIEGALYALFPDVVKRAMAEVVTWRATTVRAVGVAALALGAGLMWWLWA